MLIIIIASGILIVGNIILQMIFRAKDGEDDDGKDNN